MSAPGDRPRGRSAGPSRRAGTVPARTPAAPRRDRLPPGAPAHRLTGGPTGARQAARPGAARQTAGHRRARAERRHRRRLRLLGTGITLALLALVARLAFVQVLDGSRYAAYASGETQHEVVLPATRGAIYDRSGDLLAISVPRADVIADDFQITRPNAEADALAPVLHQSATKLAHELSERNGFVVVAREVSSSVETQAEKLGLAGITFQADTMRVSPDASLFEPLLGGLDYAGHGAAALELKYDGLLSGKVGSEVVPDAPGGVQLPGNATDVVPPRQGTGLVLTIDEPLQVEVTRDVEAQMIATHAQTGLAVVEDVHTGGILAMVDLVAGRKGKITEDPVNLAEAGIYQPGSVMKLATFSYALQTGLITPTTVLTVPYTINVGGYTFVDADVHPTEQLSASSVLAQSSNVGTIEIAQRLGTPTLYEAFHALGFGLPTGLDWPGESDGILGSPATWYGSAEGSVPIGTGVAVTPQQILDAYTAVANGGMFVTPHVVAGTVSSGGVEHLLGATKEHRVLDASTAAELVPMLNGVTKQDGTAPLADIPGYDVSGKTGTAQVPIPNGVGYVPGDFNATFVGFVPSEAPALSAIVVLNHPNSIYGGTVAAPVFSKIMQYALRRFDIAPPVTTLAGASTTTVTTTTTTTAPPTTTVASVPRSAATVRRPADTAGAGSASTGSR